VPLCYIVNVVNHQAGDDNQGELKTNGSREENSCPAAVPPDRIGYKELPYRAVIYSDRLIKVRLIATNSQ
jgi:hypothetical protein